MELFVFILVSAVKYVKASALFSLQTLRLFPLFVFNKRIVKYRLQCNFDYLVGSIGI